MNRSAELKMIDEKRMETGGFESHNVFREEIEDFIHNVDDIRDCVVLYPMMKLTEKNHM